MAKSSFRIEESNKFNKKDKYCEVPFSEKMRTSPGINPNTILSHFSPEEKSIIDCLGRYWYVTNGGADLNLGMSSNYRYVLIKPIDIFQEMFNIDREIVAVFSSYESFEPRTLDAFDAAIKRHQKLRIERICSVIISKDENIETKLRDLLQNDQESQIVVPFTYQELLDGISDPFFFRNRFQKHFYTRDLFASEAPLKKDLYFFGRTSLVHSLVNRHSSGQVSGLFGLRKTGKTSVIFGVQRTLERDGKKSVFVDCQNPAFHRNRWNKALRYVLIEMKQQYNLTERIGNEEQYTEENASTLFEKHLTRMQKELGSQNVLLIFDEIENITPTVSPTKHWRDNKDFVYFWQTLRSLFQKLPNVFSYLIVGTNPLCVELSRVEGVDNPIYGQIPLEYIPRFDVPDVREMVRRLGRIMGLQFQEVLYGKMTEDFGGHPYLIRHLCSVINKSIKGKRPVKVNKTHYEDAKKLFMRDYSHHIDMILDVLKNYFNDEFEMLMMLAIGDNDTFNEFASMSNIYTNHLLGYGIIEDNDRDFSFRVEAIKDFLFGRYKYKRIAMDHEEMLSEISERRNNLEPQLRRLCRMQLLVLYGEATARDYVIGILGTDGKRRCGSLSYSECFDARKSLLYFSDLVKIINKYWDAFKNIFGPDRGSIIGKLEIINKYRADAHAKPITKSEFQMFRLSIEEIENSIESFFEG